MKLFSGLLVVAGSYFLGLLLNLTLHGKKCDGKDLPLTGRRRKLHYGYPGFVFIGLGVYINLKIHSFLTNWSRQKMFANASKGR